MGEWVLLAVKSCAGRQGAVCLRWLARATCCPLRRSPIAHPLQVGRCDFPTSRRCALLRLCVECPGSRHIPAGKVCASAAGPPPHCLTIKAEGALSLLGMLCRFVSEFGWISWPSLSTYQKVRRPPAGAEPCL